MKRLFNKLLRRPAQARVEPATIPAGTRQLDPQELLDGIPHLHPAVKCHRDRRHGFLLAWRMVDPRRQERTTRLGRLLRGQARRYHRLVLDPLGRRTVELIDAHHTLREIAATLARESGHRLSDMEQAVIAFITQLAHRNVVALYRRDQGKSCKL